MKKLPILTIIASVVMFTGVAHADTPVTKTKIGGAYTYTATIGQATNVTATPRDSAYLPSTTGGCHLVFHVNPRNHAKIIDALYCDTPGTIAFRTPAVYTCGVTFELTVTNGPDVSTYTDQLTGPCPPPPPPGINVTTTATSVTFTNPATITQSNVTTIVVAECGHLTSLDPFTVNCRLNYAGIGLNRYTYWTETIGVTLAPGQTVVVSR